MQLLFPNSWEVLRRFLGGSWEVLERLLGGSWKFLIEGYLQFYCTRQNRDKIIVLVKIGCIAAQILSGSRTLAEWRLLTSSTNLFAFWVEPCADCMVNILIGSLVIGLYLCVFSWSRWGINLPTNYSEFPQLTLKHAQYPQKSRMFLWFLKVL